MQVSVLTTAINEGDAPRKTIESARRNTKHDAEYVICDQGGNDTDGWDVVIQTDQIGCHEGHRLAFEASSGDVVVDMDSHMAFSPYWLENALVRIDEEPGAWWNAQTAYIQPEDWTMRAPFLQHSRYVMKDGWIGSDWGAKLGKYAELLVGACYFCRREIVDRIGGFGSRAKPHLGGLNISWGWKAHACGIPIRMAKEIIVGHLYRKKKPYSVPISRMYADAAWVLTTLEPAWAVANIPDIEPIRHHIIDRLQYIVEESEAFSLLRTKSDEEVVSGLNRDFRLAVNTPTVATCDIVEALEERFGFDPRG